LQRIAATLAEESAPTESEMKREGMLYRYLRDYTPSSPMNSPLDAIPYDFDVDDEILDIQQWWGEQLPRRDSSPGISPSIDVMDTSAFALPMNRPSVTPIAIPETVRRTSTASANGDQMHISPTNTMGSMLPPMVPQLARMKRKGTLLYS
jgi:hypothetical protein